MFFYLVYSGRPRKSLSVCRVSQSVSIYALPRNIDRYDAFSQNPRMICPHCEFLPDIASFPEIHCFAC